MVHNIGRDESHEMGSILRQQHQTVPRGYIDLEVCTKSWIEIATAHLSTMRSSSDSGAGSSMRVQFAEAYDGS